MYRSIIRALLLLGMISISTTGCKSDADALAPEDETSKKLEGTWRVKSVTLTGIDATSFYTNLAVTFAGDQFTCVNAVDPVWPDRETYTVDHSGDRFVIRRGDGVDMAVVTITDQTLILEFDWSGPAAGGRQKGIMGGYQFEFSKAL